VGSVTYTVTSANSGGSVSFGVVITVNDIAPDVLNYPSPNVFTIGSPIINISPSIAGTIISYSVSPALPAGLSLNTSSGVISGTPSVVVGSSTYTVTAVNSGGTVSFGVVITVNDIAPSNLSYASPNVFTKNTSITSLSPSVSGGTVLSYSVSPALPAGLSLDTANGVISGTPSVVVGSGTYTVTAVNSGGTVSFGVVIAVENTLSNIENNTSNLIIFPNPFEDIIHITKTFNKVSYKLFSTEGKLIQDGMIHDSKIELRDLSSGQYIIKLYSNGKVETKKIIKR